MVESVNIDPSGLVTVGVLLTTTACPLKDKLTADVTAAVAAVPGVGSVSVRLGVMNDAQRAELRVHLRGDAPASGDPFAQPGSRTRVYAVASGKGGVGKSSVTVNLAVALAAEGCRSACSTPISTASRSPACSVSRASRPRSIK